MRKIIGFFCVLLMLTSCNAVDKNETAGTGTSGVAADSENSQESKEERNKQVAMQSIQALLNKNADEALKNLAPDAVDYFDGSGAPTKGIDSIKAGMKMWLSNMQEYKGDNLEAVADGNKVMVYGDWSGTFTGDFMGMKTAGKTFKVKDVDIFTFNGDGKITEHRSVQSMAGLMASIEP